jgi:hypothetical protein
VWQYDISALMATQIEKQTGSKPLQVRACVRALCVCACVVRACVRVSVSVSVSVSVCVCE